MALRKHRKIHASKALYLQLKAKRFLVVPTYLNFQLVGTPNVSHFVILFYDEAQTLVKVLPKLVYFVSFGFEIVF